MRNGETVSPPTELLFNHLRRAVRNAIVLLLVVFVLGIIAGWAAATWSRGRVHAASLVVGAGIPWLWFVWAYARTNGLMHHSGFGRSKERE